MAGDAGPSAAQSVEVESKCVAEPASPRTVSVRVWSRRDVPATPSPALVRPPPKEKNKLNCYPSYSNNVSYCK